MPDIYLKGLLLGFAMILPIGPQNAFVISQGIRRQYHLMVAGICFSSDTALILLGVFGGGALINQSPLLLQLVTWGGVVFLLWYGFGAFRAALRVKAGQVQMEPAAKSRWHIALIVLAVTWLNPHVYLDTVVVLGSIGGQMLTDERQWFALGALSASFIWFFALAVAAAKLAPWLQTALAQRIINVFIGSIMWFIAWQLARHAILML